MNNPIYKPKGVIILVRTRDKNYQSVEEKDLRCLYCHTFPNGKRYIGVAKDATRRWWRGKGYSHNRIMTNAINKYGWENITHEILLRDLPREEAEIREREYIALYKTTERGFGYNLESGGNLNKQLSEEQRKFISEQVKKRMADPEMRRRISNALKGKHPTLTEEARIKMSESRKGEKNHFYGKTHTEENRKKMSEFHKGNKYNLGRVQSPETIAKISETRKKHKVNQLNLDGVYVATFESMTQAAKITGIAKGNIISCANGKLKQAGGFLWVKQ